MAGNYTAPHLSAATYEPTAKVHSGRVYIVTGAGGGIGRATSIILAKEGATLALWDVNDAALQETLKLVKATGAEAYAQVVDIGDAQATEDATSAVVKKYGHLDGAANIGAVPQRTNKRIAEVEDAEWDLIMKINVNGMRNALRAQAKHLKSTGSVVNVASVAGLFGQWLASAYSASKHAVIGMTKVCAKDYGADGIRFNCIAPGAVDTQMLRDGLHGVSIEEVTKLHPLQRISKPEEQAQ